MAGYLGRRATAAMIAPTAGCAPATSAVSTKTAGVHRRPAQGAHQGQRPARGARGARGAARDHPAVADAAVVARPDVSLRRGPSPSWSRRRRSTPMSSWRGSRGQGRRASGASARSASPDAIPRTPAGKILRRALDRAGAPGGVRVGRYSSRHTGRWRSRNPPPIDDRLVVDVRGGAARGTREPGVHAARRGRADGGADREHVVAGRRCRRRPCRDARRSSGRGPRRRS